MSSRGRADGVTFSWSQIRRFRVYIALLAIILLVMAFAYIHVGQLKADASDLLSNICANVIAALLIYLVIELVITRAGISSLKQLGDDVASQVVHGLAPAPGVVGVSFDMHQVQWSELFQNAKEVDIVARFFDGPLQIATDATLVNFFKRGGKMRVLVADPSDQVQMAAILKQRVGSSKIRHRPIADRIDASLNILVNALTDARADTSALKIYLYEQSINYSAYCFDQQVLLLAPVEHSVSLSSARAPRIEIDLTVEPLALDFWQNESKELFTDQRLQAYDDVFKKTDQKSPAITPPSTTRSIAEEEATE